MIDNVLHDSIVFNSPEVCIGISATLEDGVGDKHVWILDVSPVKHNVSKIVGNERMFLRISFYM